MVVEVRVERFDSPTARTLVAELDADLTERYGGGEAVRADAAEFAPPAGSFLVAYDGAVPVGCAGIRPIDDETAELKRMWVRPAARRRGVARTLLAACEAAARDVGYRRLWLETGIEQPEALALYEAAGYTPVRPFGQYAASPRSRYLGINL